MKDPINIAEALAGWGGAQTPLFASHPLISLIQHAFEPSDPITAAPAWQTSGPHHLLLTSGQRDQQDPASTADKAAMAALIPQIEPDRQRPMAPRARRISPQSGSLSRTQRSRTSASPPPTDRAKVVTTSLSSTRRRRAGW